MAKDEAGTLEVLLEHRGVLAQVVAAHGGRPVSSAGDDLLAEFASVLGAVRAALVAQAALAERNRALPAARRLSFRIGVHSGDVIEVGGGLFGHSVNVTARLQSVAAPGGVAVTAAVHDQVRRQLPQRFRDGGSRRVKNLPDRVHVYHAESAAAGRVLRSNLAALVGGWLRLTLLAVFLAMALGFLLF